jgi:hypothetical protein
MALEALHFSSIEILAKLIASGVLVDDRGKILKRLAYTRSNISNVVGRAL